MSENFVGMLPDTRTALAYIFAGKAIVTLRSLASGTRFTFKIKASSKEKCTRFFVSFLFGQDNEKDYRYIGQIINNKFELTRSSRDAGYSEKTPAYVAFAYVFSKLIADIPPANAKFEVWHEGRCGRCGRKLTVPESVSTGFGPECINMVSSVQVSTVMQQERKERTISRAAHRQNFSADLETYTVRRSVKKQINVISRPAEHPAINRLDRASNLDTKILAKVAEYKKESPENYYQDGMLTEDEAFKVAYNKFLVQANRSNHVHTF